MRRKGEERYLLTRHEDPGDDHYVIENGLVPFSRSLEEGNENTVRDDLIRETVYLTHIKES